MNLVLERKLTIQTVGSKLKALFWRLRSILQRVLGQLTAGQSIQQEPVGYGRVDREMTE
jgi:hypothetical protein